MRRVLSLLLLGGLLVAVHAQQQANIRAKRGFGFSLKALFKQKQAEIQNNAGGVQELPPAQETNSNLNLFKLAPPAPPPAPPAPPIQDVEESWCAPEWNPVASVCIKIFEDEQVSLEEAIGKCKQLPEYKGESASLLEVSAGKPNARENQYIKNHSNGVGNLWISTQYDSVDYVINKSTGQVVMEISSNKHGYVCGAAPGKGRRIRKK